MIAVEKIVNEIYEVKYQEKIEQIKFCYRAYLIHKNDLDSVKFGFYTVLSNSYLSEIEILKLTYKYFHEHRKDICESIGNNYNICNGISKFLGNYYYAAKEQNISLFLQMENNIFNFLDELLSSNQSNCNKVELVDLLSAISITALVS